MYVRAVTDRCQSTKKSGTLLATMSMSITVLLDPTPLTPP